MMSGHQPDRTTKSYKGFFGWFRRLLAEEPIQERTYLKVNAIVALLIIGGPVAFLLVLTSKPTETPPIPVEGVYTQIGLGAMLLLLSGIGALQREDRGRIIAFQGALYFILLVGLALIWVQTLHDFVSDGSRPARMSHAPGILALLVGYAVRQVVECRPRAEPVPPDYVVRTTKRGMIAGGCMDALLMALMVYLFVGGR